jgi:PhzF family phenazine biosynthesis protein
MQRMAAYYNWSEIVFVKPIEKEKFHIRWFSPLDEAPLCGHATLAASHILFSKKFVNDRVIEYSYDSGILRATLNDDQSISMLFPKKPVFKCSEIPFSVSSLFGIDDYIEILKDDLIYIVVMKNSEAVKRAIPNFNLIKEIDARAIAITGRDNNGELDFSSRYFAPKVGIFEDPVCGSMHCRLACYWQTILGKSHFRAYQASQRSGIIDVEVTEENVKLSGKAVIICVIKCPNIFQDFT